MSDDPMAAVLAALADIRAQMATRDDVTHLRTDLMERMNRLQHRMDSLDEHMTMGLGHSDRVEKRAQAVAEDNRLLGEQMMSLTKLLRQLEGRINGLEDKQ
jgi:predicted nuclease with TOPRIM domain